MRQITHFIRHHRKTTPGFASTGRFDRRVEGEQVGLLGNTFDHIQDVPDVVGTGIKGFNLSAGQADLLRQLRHRLDGLLHHFTTIVSLFAGTTGVLGRIRGVARDFLGGSP